MQQWKATDALTTLDVQTYNRSKQKWQRATDALGDLPNREIGRFPRICQSANTCVGTSYPSCTSAWKHLDKTRTDKNSSRIKRKTEVPGIPTLRAPRILPQYSLLKQLHFPQRENKCSKALQPTSYSIIRLIARNSFANRGLQTAHDPPAIKLRQPSVDELGRPPKGIMDWYCSLGIDTAGKQNATARKDCT